jgi:hypothetical protein
MRLVVRLTEPTPPVLFDLDLREQLPAMDERDRPLWIQGSPPRIHPPAVELQRSGY